MLLSFNKVNVCSDLRTHFTTCNIPFSLCLRPLIGDCVPSSGDFATVIKITLKTWDLAVVMKINSQAIQFDLKHPNLVLGLEGYFHRIYNGSYVILLRNLMSDEPFLPCFLFLYLFWLSARLFFALVFWTNHQWVLQRSLFGLIALVFLGWDL